MRREIPVTILSVLIIVAAYQPREAPAAFDDKSNGAVNDSTHQVDKATFEEVEELNDGLGPLYNAQSCRECHQSPVSGAASQVHGSCAWSPAMDRTDDSANPPTSQIAHGAAVISGRSLVNDRAIYIPTQRFQKPKSGARETTPTETIRALRLSVNLLGDGFVEAVADQSLIDAAQQQCKSTNGKSCGQALFVPIVEAPGQMGVGRFGWKDQHASLLSFAADAYLNEMGITNRLQPDEVTTLCNTAAEPNDKPGADGLADIDHFAQSPISNRAT